MSILRLRTDRDETWHNPRSIVAGNGSWHLDDAAEAIEVRLFWFTEGKGTQDVAVVDTLRVERPEPSGSRRFELRLPDGPYSFSGTLITLRWALELVVLPGDESTRLDLLVGPRPVEVSLQGLREF